MTWDESKANDKEYLKKYYQSRIDRWKELNPIKGKKVINRYQTAIEKLS